MDPSYDLIVVGGTPAGIACAVRAAREGLTVLLINHTLHLGGFMTSGAGGWEAPYDGPRSPIYDETKARIAEDYRATYGEDSPQYRASIPDPTTRSRFGRPKVEPRICEKVFDEMVAEESTLTVLKGFYVRGVRPAGGRIESIQLQELHGNQSREARGTLFADCTYEGDLAAAAGVPYRVGREARSEYREPHAGILFTELRKGGTPPPPRTFRLRSVGAEQERHGLDILPESTGEADPTVMAYNYRLILTKNPDNRVPIPGPIPFEWENLVTAASRSIVPNLPNDKIAWNGAGRLVGAQRDYPEGDWPAREAIAKKHLDAALGWLWFVQNDPAASEADREFWKDYGLAKDEFADNGHVPYEIYVREARRIVGEFVFTEHDSVEAPGLERAPIHPDSVAITDWPLDSVACTPRSVNGKWEGTFMAADVWRPAQVPYRSLLPRGVNNLLVPVALSASHVGFGTIRLEPVWMQTGEAAGVAASLAIRHRTDPGELDGDLLTRKLVNAGWRISFFNKMDQPASWTAAIQYFGGKGFFRGYDARPDATLTRATAEIWLAIFGKIRTRTRFDPTEEAKRLPDEESGETITAAELIRKSGAAAGESLLDELKISAAQPITRGDACRVLFALLL